MMPSTVSLRPIVNLHNYKDASLEPLMQQYLLSWGFHRIHLIQNNDRIGIYHSLYVAFFNPATIEYTLNPFCTILKTSSLISEDETIKNRANRALEQLQSAEQALSFFSSSATFLFILDLFQILYDNIMNDDNLFFNRLAEDYAVSFFIFSLEKINNTPSVTHYGNRGSQAIFLVKQNSTFHVLPMRACSANYDEIQALKTGDNCYEDYLWKDCISYKEKILAELPEPLSIDKKPLLPGKKIWFLRPVFREPFGLAKRQVTANRSYFMLHHQSVQRVICHWQKKFSMAVGVKIRL